MATIFAGDESGNLGFVRAEGATDYFVLALVSFQDPDSARLQIEAFKRASRLAGVDLSFHKMTSVSVRERLFDFLNTLPLTAWVLVVHKERLGSMFLKESMLALYAFFLSEAISRIPLEFRARGVLVLDEFDRSGRILLAVGRVLKARGMNRGFKKITTKRSSSEPLIQVADLIAGAAHWKFARGDAQAIKRLGDKIILGEFPIIEKPPS